MEAPYDYFAIFPGINVARVGNIPEFYYVGSEIPGVYVGKGNPDFEFKVNGKIRPQAARFRIYGYKDNKNLGEIDPSKFNGNLEIKWTVVLANKKAAHKRFTGIKEHHKDNTLRNADWPHDRTTLMAIKEQSLTFDGTKDPPDPKEFKPRVYRKNIDDKDDCKDGQELYLGKMIVEKEGSLLIIGGKGNSGSINESALITQYANNDYWYDDTSDGSVDAEVTFFENKGKSNEKKTKIINKEGKSWVLVAPPKYAPGIPNVVPLYQTILETQHPVDPDYPANDPVNYLNSDKNIDKEKGDKEQRKKKTRVNYYRDIYPIFEAVCRNSWVNKMGFMGHGSDKPGHFLNPDLEKILSNPSSGPDDKYKNMRKSILSRVRIPPKLASTFEHDGQAYGYFMPPLSGNDGDARPSYPDTYLTVTRGQYILLQKWAEGDFETGSRLPEYDYFDEKLPSGDSRRPTYSDERNFQLMVQKILKDKGQDPSDQYDAEIKFLNKAALEWSVGGAFYPGIEMTYLAYDKNTFNDKYDFRINSNIFQPGDINAYMALPWQADFNECSEHWWPAQRPDIVIPKEIYNDEKKENRKIQLDDFVNWTRGFRNNEPNRGEPKWGDMDMARMWDKLGFVIEKENILGNDKAFVEVEYADIYGVEIQNFKSSTLKNLYDLLKIALQIELSTIPPYLYALYSIKQGMNLGDIVRYKIRHVAAEEMLHASLVANLMVAIGRQPVFYSPEMIPFYPNPLPHFDQGTLLVNLSKANVETLDTFIKIEQPELSKQSIKELILLSSIEHIEPSSSEEQASVDDVNLRSIAGLYKKIRDFFEDLDNKGEIEYQTSFQLEPGMGYAPSTGADNDRGLIVIKDLKSAKSAIELIIQQGEGSDVPPTPLNNLNFHGKFNGEVKVIITEGGKLNREFNGKISGNIKGKTEKATIDGTINGKIERGTIDETGVIKGKIEGIFKGSRDNKTVEQIITGTFINNDVFGVSEEKSPNANDNDKFGAIKIETSLNGKINNATIEEDSHYNSFRVCKMYVENASESEYQLWPVIDNPDIASFKDPDDRYYTNPIINNIITTATAFNAAYSYLMLLLQNAWRIDGHKKKTLVIGGMPALMHGILKPIAMFLAETPIFTDTNAGATFGYYEFTREPNPKQQLLAAIQAASDAFPYSEKLKDAAKVVATLPDVPLPTF